MLGDDTSKIFLNTKGKFGEIDDELKEFLKYVENSSQEFADKSSKEMEVEYLILLLRDQDMIEEGKKSRELEIARKMLQKGNSIDDIVEITELDKYIVIQLKKELEAEKTINTIK